MPPSYIAGNLLSGASITPSSEDSVYPRANLFDADQSNVFRFTGGSSESLAIDLAAEYPLDSLFIGNHNFAATATLTVKAGTSPSPSTVVATPAYAETYILAKWAQASYRYVTLEITDAQPAGGVTQMGILVPGLRVPLPRPLRFSTPSGIMQQAIINRTNRGRRYALELYRLQRRELRFRYRESEAAQFQAWWEAVNGHLDPFVWVQDDDAAAAIYAEWEDPAGYLPSELADQALDPVLELNAVLLEQSLGGEITA